MPNTPSPDQTLATRADIDRLAREIAELRATIDRLARDHQIDVARTGQLQADMDLIRTTWASLKAR